MSSIHVMEALLRSLDSFWSFIVPSMSTFLISKHNASDIRSAGFHSVHLPTWSDSINLPVNNAADLHVINL